MEITGKQSVIDSDTCYCIKSRIINLRSGQLIRFPVGEALSFGNTLSEEYGINTGKTAICYIVLLYVFLKVKESLGVQSVNPTETAKVIFE